MPEEVTSQSLVARLAEACNAVGGIEKKGTNQKQNYKYVKAADVAKAFRRELFTRHIALIPDEKEFNQTGVIKTSSGGELREFTLRMDYHICDGLSNEKITVGAFGVAMDTGDKAIWKAKTGCLKYFLRTLGIVPDEKDDPEHDEEIDELLDPPKLDPKLAQKMKAQERLNPGQVQQVWDAMRKAGVKPAELEEKLKTKGLKQVEEVTQELFPKMLNWINSKSTKTPFPACIAHNVVNCEECA